MSVAITEDHKALAATVADFLGRHQSRAAARALLDGADEQQPDFWNEAAQLGWLGLHVPEQFGGSGYSLEELVVVVEELGRGITPGAFVPTMVGSAVLTAAGDPEIQQRLLPGLADGSVAAAIGLDGSVEISNGTVSGRVDAVIGIGLADVIFVASGDDVAIVNTSADGVTIDIPTNLDVTRRVGRVTFDGATADVVTGARQTLVDYARTIFAAEAVGIARECTEQAAAYAKERQQFGRPIAMFQAVKHHCANMLVATELATAAVWDAARASTVGGDQFSLTAAIAATSALDAAHLCANLNIQVHGGIGFTWEHDAHLYLRRAAVLKAVIGSEAAAIATTDLTRAGVKRERNIDLPPEAEAIRSEVQAFVAEIKDLDADAQRARLIDSGYVMPHWPEPYGRAAGAVEQLVIEQEFAAAKIQRPQYGITGWVILTLIQHSTDDQIARWVRSALTQEIIWCQLFSEPDAGSDAAGVKTQRDARRRRMAPERPEGVDQRCSRGRPWTGDGSHQPGRSEAQRDHHDGHRHARRGRRSAPAEDARRSIGVQRGVLQ